MNRALPEAVYVERVIPVARGLDDITAPPLVEALARGGISTIEITIEGNTGLRAIEAVAGSGSIVAAGTVLSVGEAERAMDSGATFLVSPHLDTELLSWAVENEVPLIPGAFTPSEIAAARRFDPPAIKLFPASLGGPGHIKSLFGPYPDLVVIPTGGIDGDNASAYLAAGAMAVGVGSWLTSHDDLDLVCERAALLRSRVV